MLIKTMKTWVDLDGTSAFKEEMCLKAEIVIPVLRLITRYIFLGVKETVI